MLLVAGVVPSLDQVIVARLGVVKVPHKFEKV